MLLFFYEESTTQLEAGNVISYSLCRLHFAHEQMLCCIQEAESNQSILIINIGVTTPLDDQVSNVDGVQNG